MCYLALLNSTKPSLILAPEIPDSIFRTSHVATLQPMQKFSHFPEHPLVVPTAVFDTIREYREFYAHLRFGGVRRRRQMR